MSGGTKNETAAVSTLGCQLQTPQYTVVERFPGPGEHRAASAGSQPLFYGPERVFARPGVNQQHARQFNTVADQGGAVGNMRWRHPGKPATFLAERGESGHKQA